MVDPIQTSIQNVSVSDQATAKDSLGFDPYVKAIAEFLTNPKTKPPLTLSVEGEWGSGKSSFMKQLRREIEEISQKPLREKLLSIEKWMRRFLLKIFYVWPQKWETYNRVLRVLWLLLLILPTRILLFISDLILSLLFKVLTWFLLRFKAKPKSVWFNAWRHDKAEALWAAFALEFIRQISEINIRTVFALRIVDILLVIKGHILLFFLRIQWTVDALLDALKTIAQLILGIAAIATILIFSLGQGSDWVVKLSERVEDFNTVIQKTNKSEEKKSKENQTPPSNQANKNQSPTTSNVEKSTETKTDNPLSLPIGAAGIGGSSLIVISLWKQLKKMIGDPKKELVQYLNSPNYQSQVAFIEKFHQDFKKVVDAYVGNDKVYVFIDDLDRCELPKSAELMQALNLMISEDPSIIFILGMDREKVAAGLAVKYQELLPYLLPELNDKNEEIPASQSSRTGIEYGYAFIEKFVQLPFFVPQPSDADVDYFLQQIAIPSAAEISLIQRSWQGITKLIQAIPQWWQQFISQFGKQLEVDKSPEVSIKEEVPQTVPPLPQEEEQKLERRQRIKLNATKDSTTQDMTRMVASALDYNPRRLKQFINLFRLRAYIASDTGLFDEWVDKDRDLRLNTIPIIWLLLRGILLYRKSDCRDCIAGILFLRKFHTAVNKPITLEQLGKFVAIILKWPLILPDLEDNPNLLKNLEVFSLPESGNNLKYDDRTKDWGNRQKLKELICYGLDKNNRDDFSLAAVEVEKLLQVSPQGGRRKDKNQSFTEELGGKVTLEMVAIPGGKFLMGSPEGEPDRDDSESPQHEVTVPLFFMSQHLITQAQWREIASLRRVKRYLNPEPSYFKGDNRPVESILWYDAMEFCARLSRLTGRKYRLPSEAEWEYGCRAGTTTPFHFGETITSELANYDGNYTYASEPKGEYRKQTTPVASFPPNAFGLYDMHGNVWEWCEDDWHKNYNGAPTDGSAWLDENENRSPYRLLRGGSWNNYPQNCRSAYRNRLNPDDRDNNIGLRVVASSRT